jgi:hypothetical protein
MGLNSVGGEFFVFYICFLRLGEMIYIFKCKKMIVLKKL